MYCFNQIKKNKRLGMEHMIYHHEIASQTTSVKYTNKETF